MINENVMVSIISACAGILVAYITTKYKSREQRPRAQDKIDMAFEAYERIIKQQQLDIDNLRERLSTCEEKLK